MLPSTGPVLPPERYGAPQRHHRRPAPCRVRQGRRSGGHRPETRPRGRCWLDLGDPQGALDIARATEPGGRFTLDGAPYTRGRNPVGAAARDEHGRLVHLDRVEHRAFWAWATVEFLRHTGVRVEEMLGVTHHAMIQYRLPTTGEIVPLLQIAPSKTDVECVLLVSPELADVLATIIRRVRDPKTGQIPLVTRYDDQEPQWNAPAPVLFQYDRGGEPSTLNPQTVRDILKETAASTRLADAIGRPLQFTPQDFRRMFITDATAPAFRPTSPRSSPATPTSVHPVGAAQAGLPGKPTGS